MADALELTRVRLPVNLQGDDILGLHDQMKQRMDALLEPAAPPSRRRGAAPAGEAEQAPVLPPGVTPMKVLPEAFAPAWGRFSDNITALGGVRDARDSIAAGPDARTTGDEKSESNVECDDSFRAFESWVESQTMLRPDGKTPTPADARWLYAAVFPAPEGLRFITYRPRRQWLAMKPRMDLLAGERAQQIITGFGGTRHYDQLAASYTRYGRAFGFLAVVSDDDTSDTRPEFLAAKDGLRELVHKIEAYAEPTRPGSVAIAQFLLRPFIDLVAELGAEASRARKAAGEGKAAGNGKVAGEGKAAGDP